MTDLRLSAGTSEPDPLLDPSPDPRRRRFGRFPAPRAPSLRRPASITEAAPQRQVNVREGLYRRSLAVADAIAAVSVLTFVVSLDAGAGLQLWVTAAIPLIVLVNKVAGLYERDELVLNKTTLDEAPSLLQISGLFALIVWLGHYRLVAIELSPTLVFELWMGTFAMLVVGRAVARRLVARVAHAERCLVLGDDASIRMVSSKLETACVNTEVVASVSLDPAAPRVDTEAFRALVHDHDVHRVIVAPVTTDAADTLDLIRVAKGMGVRVSILPRLFEVVGSSVEFDQVDGLTMLGVRRFGLTRSSHVLKRAFDFVGASFMLIVSAPILLAAAIAVRLDSKGPVLFRQVRVGRDGRPFHILKFRTMVPDADRLKSELAHLNETDGLFKIAADPRITRVGRLLRSVSLDELPQLLNVWHGEMSLVGPRPLVVDEDAKIEGLDRSRLHLTPGMTGHWQILGSTRIPLSEMVGIDYLYVANWSLWTDMKILLRTVVYVLSRRGI